jgi:hypothetical protein
MPKFVGLDDSLCPQLRHIVDLKNVRLPLGHLAFSSLCVEKGWKELNSRVLSDEAMRKRARVEAESPTHKLARVASRMSLATFVSTEDDAASVLVKLQSGM